MKAKSIVFYISEFLLTIFLFLLLACILLQATLFNASFMQSIITRENFVSDTTAQIEEEFSYYILQSGLSEEVLNGLITESEMATNIEEYVTKFYNGEEIVIATDELQTRLEDNIVTYLEQNNIVVADEASLDQFVKEIVNTYKQNVEDAFSFSLVQKPFIKIKNILPFGLGISVLLFLGLAIFSMFFCKRENLSIPLLATGLLYGCIWYYLAQNLDMKNFYVYTTAFSNLVKGMYEIIHNYIGIIAIIFLVSGFLSGGIYYFFKTMKEQKTKSVSGAKIP